MDERACIETAVAAPPPHGKPVSARRQPAHRIKFCLQRSGRSGRNQMPPYS